jgi:predicted transcriptional regulator
MTLLNVMTDKNLVTRKPEGRAFRYTAKVKPEQTESKIIGSILDRVFDGSAVALVARLLEQSKPTGEELDQIRKLIDEHKKKSR